MNEIGIIIFLEISSLHSSLSLPTMLSTYFPVHIKSRPDSLGSPNEQIPGPRSIAHFSQPVRIFLVNHHHRHLQDLDQQENHHLHLLHPISYPGVRVLISKLSIRTYGEMHFPRPYPSLIFVIPQLSSLQSSLVFAFQALVYIPFRTLAFSPLQLWKTLPFQTQ